MILSTRRGWPALVVIAGMAISAAAWQLHPLRAKATSEQVTPTPNEGYRRQEVLRHLTEIYVSRGQGVSARMRAGLELAPTPFLNAELERQGAKWRVRLIAGSDVEFFAIS